MKYGRFLRVAGGWDALQRVLRAADAVARRHDVSIANVASRYVLEQPAVAGVIIGARPGEREHIADNLRVFSFSLTGEDREELEAALATLRPDSRRLRRRVPQAAVSHGVRRSEPSRGVVPGALRGASRRAGGRVLCLSGTPWESIAGFSRATRRGARVHVSGTTATHGDRVIGGTDPAAQTHFAIDKIEGALQSLGAKLEDVVRTRVFVARMADWEAVARAHGERFRHIQPANTLVAASLVGDEYLVEVEAEAEVGRASHEDPARNLRDHARRRRSRRLAPGDLSGQARVPRDAPRAPPRSPEDGGAASAGRSINLALANRGIAALEEVGVMESVRSALIPMAGQDASRRGRAAQADSLRQQAARGHLLGLARGPEHAPPGCRRIDRPSLDPLRRDGLRRRFREPAGAAAGDSPTTSSSGRTEAPRRFAPRSWNGPADGSTRSRSATGTRSSRSPRQPAAGFRMEKNALHIWPRGEYMLIALPNVDGSFTVTLFLPNQGEESFQALTTPEAVDALFERRFADAIPLMPGLAEDFFGNPTGHLETIRCAPWSFEDHALVLGDAAHAIVPFHGQGMNAAFEDCSAFDRCLRRSGSPVERGLRGIREASPARYRRDRRHGPGELRRDAVDRPGAEVSVEEGSFLPPRGEAPRPVHPPLFDGDVPHDSLRRGEAAGSDSGGNPRRVDEPRRRASIEVDLARADRLIAERLGTI